jgi:hypothetical protein
VTPRTALVVLRKSVLASLLLVTVAVPSMSDAASASAARTLSCNEPQLKFANRAIAPALSNVADLVEITNVSRRACTLTGYAKVTLTTAASPTPVVAAQRRRGYFGGVSPTYRSQVLPVFILGAHTGTASFIVEESDEPLGSATPCPLFTSLSFTLKGFDFTYTFPVRLPACNRPGVLPIVKGTKGSWGF